jgi:diguanylate cyclase (GGDEF)-like protein/PAS domain S-box-containing protein
MNKTSGPDFYHSFFELSTDAMYIGHPDGTIIEVNQAWLDLFGYTREQLSEFNVRDAYATPQDRAAFIAQIVEKGLAHDEVRFRRRDGTVFDCERTGIAVTNPDGTLAAIQGIMRHVSQRKAAQRRLEESEAKFRALFENTMDAIGLVSPGGLLLEANDAYLKLFGYSHEDIGTFNVETQYLDANDRTRFLQWMATNDSIVDEAVRLRKRDGTVMDCLRNVFVRRDAEGSLIGEQCVIREMTERRRAEHELQASEERFRSLFEQSMDAIYVVEYDGSSMQANRAWMELFGYTANDLATLNIIELYANPADREHLLRKIAQTGVVADEVKFKKKDGTVFDCARTVTARRDSNGNIVAFQGIMRDITSERRDHDELQRLASYDMLTGLLNRRALLGRLEEWMQHVERYGGKFSVMMLDLDHFKRVNDTYGHQVGDHVLARTAEVLQRGLRQTDFVGRYGGEEFLVVMPHTTSAGARVVAERVRTLMQRTRIENSPGKSFTVTVSLGISARRQGDTIDSLVGRADEALYIAKANGRNRVQLLEPA